MNESTWLKVPPPPEVVAWASQDVGASVKPLTAGEWVELMENADLRDIRASTREISAQDEARRMVQRYGFWGMLRVWGRMLRLYMRNPAYRRFVKGLREGGLHPVISPSILDTGSTSAGNELSKLLFSLRHTQHHLGEVNAELIRRGLEGVKWR